MSIWFLLWFVLSFILLGSTIWSTIILIQQKQAWADYAKRKGLNFARGTFFSSASVDGTINNCTVSLFTATQQNEDSRRNRELTVVQINSDASYVDGMACGTSQVLPFLKSLDTLSPHTIKNGKWNKKFYLFSRNKKAIEIYLTEERIKVLNGILSMPNADVVVLIAEEEAIFRFETANPLKDVKQLETIIDKMMARIDILKPSPEEAEELEAIVNKTVTESELQEPEPEVVEEVQESNKEEVARVEEEGPAEVQEPAAQESNDKKET